MARIFSKEVASQTESRSLKKRKTMIGYTLQCHSGDILIAQVSKRFPEYPNGVVSTFIELNSNEFNDIDGDDSWEIIHVWAVPKNLARQFIEHRINEFR